jgi:hypothetical protein
MQVVKSEMGTVQMLWALLANKCAQSRCVTDITGSKFVLNYWKTHVVNLQYCRMQCKTGVEGSTMPMSNGTDEDSDSHNFGLTLP